MDLSDRYSSIDRLLHRLAFATASVQIEMADLEDRIFKGELAGVEATRPVFITALPRAGTTLLLELCVALDEFASHCYRDMPFVLLPMLWDKLARGFRRSDAPTERAHGDGMMVSLDSPEAFEEMIWRVMWPDHYRADRIVPWDRCDNPEFPQVFRNHLRKIVKLRQRNPALVPRYVSKNNGSIARTGAMLEICPDATIVVVMREPVQHAASLLRQHIQFLGIHARDRFAREYMKGIGHLEFGANLRPIDFDGWMASARHTDPSTIEFWLEYWVATYSHLLERQGSVHFLPYDWFCTCPDDGLAWLAGVLDIRDRERWMAQRTRIKIAALHKVDSSRIDRRLLSRANELYHTLVEYSLGASAAAAADGVAARRAAR
jgi:hypothetical protein